MLVEVEQRHVGAFAGDATNASTSALPTGLTLGTTAVALPADNGRYAGPTTGTRDQILAAIGSASHIRAR